MASKVGKQAKKIIFTILDEATTSQWLKLEQRYLIPTPSRASGGDFIESYCCDVQAKLQEGFVPPWFVLQSIAHVSCFPSIV